MGYTPRPVPAFIQSTDELRMWLEEELLRISTSIVDQPPTIADFGAVEGEDASKAIFALIADRRLYMKNQIDTIGGDLIDMYAGCEVLFPDGVWTVPPNVLNFTQEHNVRFKGTGHRGMTIAMQGRCTLLIDGAANNTTGYGIRIHRGGARSFGIEQMDVCYADETFEGRLVWCIDAPGLRINEAYIGTFGNSASDRKTSAHSLVSVTYDEGFRIHNSILSGGIRGVLFDDVTEELGNSSFGGWGAHIQDTTMYEFTQSHVEGIGDRERNSLLLTNVTFNPINIDPDRCVDLRNIRSLSMRGCNFLSSTTAAPDVEWMRLTNCFSDIKGCAFGQLAKGLLVTGTGAMDFTNNVVYSDGFVGVHVQGGVITGGGNRFFAATDGWRVEDNLTNLIVFDKGPDIFSADVTNSINVLSNSARISGRMAHSTALDLSSAGVTNPEVNLIVTEIT